MGQTFSSTCMNRKIIPYHNIRCHTATDRSSWKGVIRYERYALNMDAICTRYGQEKILFKIDYHYCRRINPFAPNAPFLYPLNKWVKPPTIKNLCIVTKIFIVILILSLVLSKKDSIIIICCWSFKEAKVQLFNTRNTSAS